MNLWLSISNILLKPTYILNLTYESQLNFISIFMNLIGIDIGFFF